MKSILLFAFLSFSFITSLYGTVTIKFSDTGSGTWADGYQNSSGNPTNGMDFGLVVDTAGNGFDGDGSTASYTEFSYNTGSPSNATGFLNVGGSASDDYFTVGSTDFNGLPLETEDASAAGGPNAGVFIGIQGLDVLTESLNGKSYGVIWMESDTANAGDNYGFVDSTLTIPADGSTVDHSGTFSGLTPGSASLQFQAVPEPAHVALGFGLLTVAVCAYTRMKSKK